jgi:acetylornithine/succinyldiaminopimelate/putrescine aminotransferase
MGERLLLLTCGTFENVIRWIPPLVVSDAQIDDALAVFARALAATGGSGSGAHAAAAAARAAAGEGDR